MKPPLWITGKSVEGQLLVGGVFAMKDEVGFPMDMSYEILMEKGMGIDYCELLCSAWLNDCLKFYAVCRELDMLGGSHVEEWQKAGAAFMVKFPKALNHKNPVDVFCRYVLRKKILTASNHRVRSMVTENKTS